MIALGSPGFVRGHVATGIGTVAEREFSLDSAATLGTQARFRRLVGGFTITTITVLFLQVRVVFNVFKLVDEAFALVFLASHRLLRRGDLSGSENRLDDLLPSDGAIPVPVAPDPVKGEALPDLGADHPVDSFAFALRVVAIIDGTVCRVIDGRDIDCNARGHRTGSFPFPLPAFV